MIPFLKQVADHYYSEGDISSRCFVFPNRRAMVFFVKHLADRVKAEKAPIQMPALYTINDFFYKVSGVSVTDRVTLLIKLYNCYKELYPNAESLDEFIFWGDVILNDFQDVDKYLADPKKIFTNIADFKAIQDDLSYLEPSQKEAIMSFVRHFSDKNGRLTVDLDLEDGGVKAKFLQIWNLLYPMYSSYNELLKANGMAYEGMVYRNLATRLQSESAVDILSESFPGSSKFIFVGLNALNKCEKVVLRKMRDAHLCEFCWDYSGEMIKNKLNKSSFFMSDNVIEFPQAMEFDLDGVQIPQVNVISVPSSVGQAKQVAKILAQSGDPNDCAVVLPDESLLVPVLNSIPEDVKEINVTMGYPMGSSVLFNFMNIVASLQLHTRKKGGMWHFHYSQVKGIYLNSVFSKVAPEDERTALKEILNQGKFYIPQSVFQPYPFLEAIFTPVVLEQKSNEESQITAIQEYQKKLISLIAPKLKGDFDMSMELDFAKAYYQGINILAKESLPIQPTTYFSLLSSLLCGVSVPFKGEPLKGLQIMGPLETRALDFSTMVILSANEGMFPRRSVSSSFIPHELRKGFDLPTYEYQDAVWAYYFYRMICRAKTVWMLYDSRTEGLKAGEESRYIKQLEYHFGIKLKRYYAQASASIVETQTDEVIKTQEDIDKIKNLYLSPSALKYYLTCPAKFYYSYVASLQAESELSEDMDAGMIGTVFHETMQALYMGDKAMNPDFDMSDKNLVRQTGVMEVITEEYIKAWLKKEDAIKARIRSLMLAQMNAIEISGRNLVVEDVILSYVKKTLQRDIEHMHGAGVNSFKIIGLEKTYYWDLDGFKFKGTVDRLDSFTDGIVRIVDYKTGRVEKEDVDINDDNYMKIADAMFGEENSARPTIAFQLFLYDKFVQDFDAKNNVEGITYCNSIYSAAKLFTDEILDVPVNDSFNSEVYKRLSEMLKELVDPEKTFRRTDDRKTCGYCDFKMICGR